MPLLIGLFRFGDFSTGKEKLNKHSSRMRTVRNSSRLLGGACSRGGVSGPGGG